MSAPAHCYRCGALCRIETVSGTEVPTCPEHGPCWLLVRVGAAADVLVERDGRLLLVQRAHEPYRGMWATVGGFVDRGERPDEAARREAKEELGLDVELLGLLGVWAQGYVGDEWLQTSVFLARAEAEPEVDPREVAGFAWFAPDELPAVMAWNQRERAEAWVQWRDGRRSLAPARAFEGQIRS